MENDFVYRSNLELQILSSINFELLKEYERQLRKYEYEKDLPITDIEKKKKANEFFRKAAAFGMIVSCQKMTIIGDKSFKSDKPKIYAATHVGRYDIETAFRIINEGNYFVMGDPGKTYVNLEGKFLDAKGRVCMDLDREKYKEDRHIGEAKCKKILLSGGNILIFPEGAWNLTANVMVQKLFNGAARMAFETGAEIVPIAIEKYGNHYYANIGENYSIPRDTIETYKELSNDLREKLATLKWDIYDQFGIQSRADFSVDYVDSDLKTFLLDIRKELLQTSDVDTHKTFKELYEKYVNDIMKNTENDYTIEVIKEERYKEKCVGDSEDVFAFRRELKFKGNSRIENEEIAMVI